MTASFSLSSNFIVSAVFLINIGVLLTGSKVSHAQNPNDNELSVYSYASQVNDVDSVNSHWFETEGGVVLIDAQRLLPEAERALAHLKASTDKPLTTIIITHAHTDHYGGLPVWKAAFPEAQVYTDKTTLASIRNDERGFIRMRNQRHGYRFATHEALREAIAEAKTVTDGDRVNVGDETLLFTVVGPSEAESTVLVTVDDKSTGFVGDLINQGAPAVPFENLDNWFLHLDLITQQFDMNDQLYQGHGPAPVTIADVEEQRRFLQTLQEEVVTALKGNKILTAAEVEQIVFNLEAEWPFYEGVAGNTRQQVLQFAAQRVAQQLGGRIKEETN